MYKRRTKWVTELAFLTIVAVGIAHPQQLQQSTSVSEARISSPPTQTAAIDLDDKSNNIQQRFVIAPERPARLPHASDEAKADGNLFAVPQLDAPDAARHFQIAAPADWFETAFYAASIPVHRCDGATPTSTRTLSGRTYSPQSANCIPPPAPGAAGDFELPPDDSPVDALNNGLTVTVDGVNVGEASRLVHRLFPHQAPTRAGIESNGVSAVDAWETERYHWRGLIGQSVLFNFVENSFRASDDSEIRDFLAHKPFWHDYAASMRQFNMRRWNDGDDFLVNYIGHPMQGAVSGFIEIQNDPKGRQQEIGANRDYWQSRFKAFLWAVAYSTHSEISPLGEAGIGNEGGWTYPLNCKTICAEPGTYKKYTNNTGWVDFIITPTVGMLWLLAEDALDRYVSDRIQHGNQSKVFPKIVRGALNPSRTMANAMRFKKPWYRDFQHEPTFESPYRVYSSPSDEETGKTRLQRFQIMPYAFTMPVVASGRGCFICLGSPAAGFGADLLITPWLGLSFATSKQREPLQKNAPAESISSWGLGVRLQHATPLNTFSLAIRPVQVTDSVTLPARPGISSASHPAETREPDTSRTAVTATISIDHRINRFLALRSSFGDTIVRLRTPGPTETGIGKPPYLSWLSHDTYHNKSLWTCQFGPMLSF